MDASTRRDLDNLHSQDKDLRYRAYLEVIAATDRPVDWAYEVWDDLVAMLREGDNHQRSIAAQTLANLAKSDPQKRMLRDFAALLAVTRDERFVTARHTLQAIWKVGAAGKEQQDRLVSGLAERFRECASEKNRTLIRYDIMVGLRQLYDAVPDEGIRETAQTLLAEEDDSTYRAKYASVWKRAKRA